MAPLPTMVLLAGLLAAAQPEPAVPAPPVPGAAFHDADLPLARAHLLALQLSAPVSTGTCAASFSVDGLLKYLADGGAHASRDASERLEQLLSCQALVLEGTAPCERLAVPALARGEAFPPEYVCRQTFGMWLHDRGRIAKEGDTAARCRYENYYRLNNPLDGGPFKAKTFEAGCALVAEYTRRGEGLDGICERLMPSFRYSTDPKDCQDRLRYAHGEDERLCTTMKPLPRMERCLDLRAFRRAVDARSEKACAASYYCRMQLRRDAASCAPHLEALRASWCAAGGAALPPLDRAAAARELEGLLKDAEKALAGRAPSDELARRKAFLEGLRRLALTPAR